MLFRPKTRTKSIPDIQLMLGDSIIYQSKSAHNLGVTFPFGPMQLTLPDLELDRLCKLQHQAAHAVPGASYRNHITPVLQNLHWLPYKQRIILKILVTAHKVNHGNGPRYFALNLKSSGRFDSPGIHQHRRWHIKVLN